MKNLLLTTAFLLITISVFSQGSYTSQNNKKSNWETAAIWTKQFSWMAAAPPGPADVGGSYIANIYGVVTRNGNLTFSGGSTLNVYDTLIVKGNFTISSSTGVVVHSGGLLIVLGDFTSNSSGGNKLINNGNVVTVGNFSHSGGAITTNNNVYSFDPTPSFGWGSGVDGVNYNGSNSNGMGHQLKNKAALDSTNPPLANYINAILGIMPVKLISFTGKIENSLVTLNWLTALEVGFDYFQVERAGADLVFEHIASINGAGYNTDDEHAYTTVDANALNGVNYYRLKSIDLDSAYEYSSVVAVHLAIDQSISVYPNPSNGDFVNVFSNFEPGENALVTIFNNEGSLIQKTSVSKRQTRIDFNNHLTSGVYLLKFTSGTYSQAVRLIVH